jgi:hypothetical protein
MDAHRLIALVEMMKIGTELDFEPFGGGVLAICFGQHKQLPPSGN